MVKTSEQIARIRASAHVLAQILYEVVALVRPGITTEELDREAEARIRAHKAIPIFKGYHGFPASLCTSINEAVVHGVPSDRAVREGDIIGLDLGLSLNGGVSDMAVTVPVGKTDPESLRLIAVTRESLENGLSAVRGGARLGDIGAAIQRYVEAAYFGIVRQFVGHGVGLALHEEPQIPNYGKKGEGVMLEAGMVLAIEPMVTAGSSEVKVLDDGWTAVTIDGKRAAHFEHTVLVTEDGCEVLTA